MFIKCGKEHLLFFIFVTNIICQSASHYSYVATFIEPAHYLRMISMSDHNEIFIAGGDDNKVHVYLNEGDNFVNHDTLVDSFHDTIVAEITGDAKWILTVDESGVVLAYCFNMNTHRY